MSRLTGEPLEAVDSAWLRMETPVNLMTITGVLTLAESLPFERFRRLIEERLVVYDRFRMRVVPSEGASGRARWVEEGFSLDDHVERAELRNSQSKAELQDLVSRQMSTPLDYDKPLWRFWFVEDFRGGSALVARIHHCIGDGMGLMKVILGMADPVDVTVPQVGPKRSGTEARHENVARRSKLLEAVRVSGSATKALARLLTLKSDPLTRFKGTLGTEKRAVWSERTPLASVKSLGAELGGTINDVLLTAATGAMRAYLLDRGEKIDGLDVRATVPVNLRPPEDVSLGNKFGLVFLSLPVGLADPLGRLRELKRRMDRLKRSPEAFVVFGVLKVLGKAHAELQSRVVSILSKNATAVMTNVPGPRGPLALCGREIDHMMFWVPQSGDVALGVSILSYKEGVR
ncbi:MAG: wax ester/triacylglycerol synthase family O-acyltransferase, partial [Acidobacteriota bacterium]|nr:wax ester/triacylglycerol synthase family O-acyltransferase [Acidobacteriota bacterium]